MDYNKLIEGAVSKAAALINEGKDRHRPGYYKELAAKRRAEGKSVDRHRPGYYSKYNKEHPERLDRGYTKGYRNGNFSDGRELTPEEEKVIRMAADAAFDRALAKKDDCMKIFSDDEMDGIPATDEENGHRWQPMKMAPK